ncbi:MAG: FG-GAP-like repeat-containing protein, partial [Saprospiraceae bacterium]
MEDCFNEYDDDGDGLVDCYDDDCAGVGVCDSFIYQYTNLPDCQFVPPTTMGEFKIDKTYQTDFINYPIDQRSGVFVGDMDSDGIPDLVGKDPSPGRIQIFNGTDGSIKQSIVIPTNSPFSQPTIADVDRDGNGDIFVMVNGNQLRRYEYGNPNVVWQTGNQIGDVSTHSSAQVADLDQDGTPEVYVGNRIFNAITGTRLAIGTGSTGKAFDSATKNHDKYPIAFDVFAPGDAKPNGGTFGPEAQGLELIAGNQVYTYTPGNGTKDNGSLEVVASISGGDFKDGFTSISDIDGDNLVDIAVMASGKIYVWNPRTQMQIGSTFDIPGTNTGGRINIGDFDNDGMVEIGTAGKSIYVVLEYDAGANALVIKWQKTGLDDGSQRTGSTLFDFEGDGINEVVYSEEAHLYVWRGTDGSELVKVPAQAGTRTEYPVVADVNNDGAAEIIITAQNGNGPGFSGNDFISVYRSMNTPWVTARKVWNQHGYFVTNINDDLTVPKEQQNPLDSDLNNAYNGFLVQTTILNANGGGATPAFAAADAIIEIDSITIESCPDLVVHSTITNQGSNDLPATTPIAFYDQDPTANAATLLGTTTVGSVLSSGEETNISTTLAIAPLIAPITVHVVINDPGTVATPYSFASFPISGVGECEFNNNQAQLTSPICIEICDDGVDNDSDGITDEPNIMATTTSGCSGMVLPTFTTDEAGGTWEVISSIGTTISNTGIVTLGTNDNSTPDIDTIIYIGGLCSDTVLVSTFDNENPQLVCPSDQSLTVDNSCMVNLPDYTGMASTGDNCSGVAEIILSQSPVSGSPITVGVTIVTITATDKSGNSMTCQFQVRVTDEIAPVITCPTDTTLYLNSTCGVSIPDFTNLATVNDNCSAPANISVSQNPAIGTLLEEENITQVIILTARDENGN